MSDRAFRSLLDLQASASTARTLSLLSVWRREGANPAWQAKPFFRSPILNRSLIVKHRLRHHESDLFQGAKRTATKVILPIDPTDLRLGAHSFFIGQAGYHAMLTQVCGPDSEVASSDGRTLAVLDTLPSLDPFLMRETLARQGIEPDRSYFQLSDADMERVFSFVQREVAPLIGISFQGGAKVDDTRAQRFARRILEDPTDRALEPLQISLGMNAAEFQEGVFCWKGFIYDKWMLSELLPNVRRVTEGMATVKAVGPATDDERMYLSAARRRLILAVNDACKRVKETLQIYEDAYVVMTRDGNPVTFRNFLKDAPGMFYALGERLGAINHIVSFWGYRFPPGARLRLPTEHLVDLFTDFEQGIVEPGAAAMAA